MQSTVIVVVAASALLQFIAAVLALRLIPVTGHKTAWLLVAAGISMMTVRRFESLVRLVSGGIHDPDVLFETVGLVISCCMAAGIYLVRPLFIELSSSREELRGLNGKLSALSEEQRKLITELQDALANIKTLRGMLPICSSCKKVRDDKGYWQQVEVYVSARSNAEFSHGLCPECAQKYYDQLDQLRSKNK